MIWNFRFLFYFSCRWDFIYVFQIVSLCSLYSRAFIFSRRFTRITISFCRAFSCCMLFLCIRGLSCRWLSRFFMRKFLGFWQNMLNLRYFSYFFYFYWVFWKSTFFTMLRFLWMHRVFMKLRLFSYYLINIRKGLLYMLVWFLFWLDVLNLNKI